MDWGERLELEQRAETLALRFGGPPADLDAIAQTVGIVQIAVAEMDQAAALHVGPLPGTWGVMLRRVDPIRRRRFSLAHETAHVALGLVGAERRYMGHAAARGSDDPTERKCDYFAACLLMPRAWVNAAVARGDEIAALASYFDVSRETMRFRLRELGHHALSAEV